MKSGIDSVKNKDKGFLEYKEWELIEELIHNLELIDKGLASDTFKQQTTNKLIENCDNDKTQLELKSLIGKYQ